MHEPGDMIIHVCIYKNIIMPYVYTLLLFTEPKQQFHACVNIAAETLFMFVSIKFSFFKITIFVIIIF